jgi:hypothetical protein
MGEGAKAVGKAIDDGTGGALTRMKTRVDELSFRNEQWIYQALDGIGSYVGVTKKATEAVEGQAAAVDDLAQAHRQFSWKDWNEYLALLEKVNDLTAKLVPVNKEADDALKQMADDGVAGLRRVADAMDSLKFTTDKQMDDMIYNVKVGWEEQVKMAGNSTGEILRINQAAWQNITAIVQANWNTMSIAQKQAIADAGAEVQRSATQYGQVLRTTTQTTKEETEKQSELWQACSKAWDKAIKTAAQSMSDTLWNGDASFGEKMKSMLTDIGQMFTQVFIQQGLKAIQKFITEGTAGFSGFFDDIKKGVSGLGNLFSGGGTAASTGGGAATGGTGGGGLSSLGGALGSIGGAVNVVSSAISAVTGVISLFQQRGQTKVEENIQDATLRLYYTTHDFFQEFHNWAWGYRIPFDTAEVAYYTDAANYHGFVEDKLNWFHQYLMWISDGLNNHLIPMLQNAAVTATAHIDVDAISGAISGAIGDAISQAISKLGTLAGGAVTNVVTNIDLSPLTALLGQIRDGLTPAALRPNVTLTVSTGTTPEEVSRAIVYQLQLAGVIR